jgi:hypothetical protein
MHVRGCEGRDPGPHGVSLCEAKRGGRDFGYDLPLRQGCVCANGLLFFQTAIPV